MLHRAVGDGFAGGAHPQPHFRLRIFSAEAKLACRRHEESPPVPTLIHVHVASIKVDEAGSWRRDKSGAEQ